ncbi:hypothetical protein MBLNU230_g3719t1 [Neophaeotheca triangularis]
MAFYQDLPWHEGETAVKRALRVSEDINPTIPGLSPQLANHLQIVPLLAVGTLDKEGRPWTTIWGGESGFARPLAPAIIGIRTPVPGQHDPVVEELVGKEATGEIVREEGTGRMVSGLTIDLETRKRVKLFGRMVAGALGTKANDDEANQAPPIPEIQLVLRIEQSLGNCPKYLNSKHITPSPSNPTLISNSPQLPLDAIDLLAHADLFFISSTNSAHDMDTNHRGGPAGFLRLASNNPSGAILLYPEYSGNRLYQTLGNLTTTPLAGLCIPDFRNGNLLTLTGRTRIFYPPEAATQIPHSTLAVEITVTHARFIQTALPFRGRPGDPSPYNPPLRRLATETNNSNPAHTSATPTPPTTIATLESQTPLTPSISRFHFALAKPPLHPPKPGQYATLDFSEHLSAGYSHMRDDDPRSLNDDFVRTFTVSSAPDPSPNPATGPKGFEIVIRNVGSVTGWLFKHGLDADDGAAATTTRARRQGPLEIKLRAFGGEFGISQRASSSESSSESSSSSTSSSSILADGKEVEAVVFVAAGVGITPLLPALRGLVWRKLRVLWTLRVGDLGLVVDVLRRHSGLGGRVVVFVTGVVRGCRGSGTGAETDADEGSERVDGDDGAPGKGEHVESDGDTASLIGRVRALGAEVKCRRLGKRDLEAVTANEGRVGKWFICTGKGLRRQLGEWLSGEEVGCEEFDF